MKTYEKIFQELLTATDFMSGEALAEQLQLSRAAIWKAIKQLEKQGIVIESLKHRGYRLLAGDILLPEVIANRTGLAVYHHVTSASTQVDAKQGIEAGNPSPALYLASSQTAARGRFSRPFFTAEQGGIYMSLHLEPQVPFDQLPSYTLLIAASIVKAIQNLAGIDTNIKWVNDIYLGNKKIAGILTEAISDVETGTVAHIIIGVGINFFISDFPEELEGKASSLFASQPPIIRNDLITEIWRIFFTSNHEDLFELYKKHSLVLGHEISYQSQGQSWTATAVDILETGELVVETSTGLQKLSSGEISLTKW
ncbi:bifunctional biotin--[acetyl-CoA-carboxylase] ligase/biotin operon repressor BirA [Streptococcus sp. 10F2]